MERFKACEKEMKTKAFSREGLTNSLKVDPREKEKVETSGFVSSMLEELEHQVETLEAEQETLHATMKKNRKDAVKQERLGEIDETLERHAWHIRKLELILRLLENGNLAPDIVNNIHDDIQYYVESNQDPEFAEDDEIYDELNLDSYEDNELDSVAPVKEEPHSSSLEELTINMGSAPASSTTKSTAVANGNSEPHYSSQQHGLVKKPSVPVIANSAVNSTLSTTISMGITTMKPAPPPTRSTNELKYASAAAALGSSSPMTKSAKPASSSSSSSSTVSSTIVNSSSSSSVPASAQSTPQVEHIKIVKQDSKKSVPKISASPLTSKATIKKSEVEPVAASNSAARPDVPLGLEGLLEAMDAAKARILNPPALASISKMLENSYLQCPNSMLADKPRYYQPETYFPTPSYYPQESLTKTFNDSAVFGKMDVDTLFYIFYYRQNTYQQYLAARELKARSWRFHKRFLTWFQRHEEPKTINNDYEQGTYRYFDFEGMWLQRRKSNFKFEYQFLEDEF
jgi:CCR4-NOT transcription complex subunit 3